jgi:all-trans-retinol 13,14-reductase
MADVQGITVESGRATGVTLESGEDVRAPIVISGAGAHRTVDLLPEPHRTSAWAQSLKRLSSAPAHVCLYLGFKGDIRQAGASGANQWFWRSGTAKTTRGR